jgi:hypothetical protein
MKSLPHVCALGLTIRNPRRMFESTHLRGLRQFVRKTRASGGWNKSNVYNAINKVFGAEGIPLQPQRWVPTMATSATIKKICQIRVRAEHEKCSESRPVRSSVVLCIPD